MEYGIQLAAMEPARFRDLAQAAEGLGFDLVVFPDHLVIEGPERQYDPHALAYDTVSIAAMVAGATKRIRIGHLVLCNLFRHPAITAQSLMTLDHISGGRLVAGLGTGWTETEFKMTGIPFPTIADRLRMLDEALVCIKSLWTQERTTFDGEFYKLHDAILWPKPLQQPHPPIIVGGGGKGLLRIAARHADVLNIIADAGKPGRISLDNVKRLTDEAYRKKVDFVREEAVRNGRSADAVRMSGFIYALTLTESAAATRQTAEMMAPMFGLTPEECVAELKRRVKQWGISQVIFSSMMGTDPAQLRRLKEEILDHV